MFAVNWKLGLAWYTLQSHVSIRKFTAVETTTTKRLPFCLTVVSRIYAPHFATLELVESVGGASMRDLTFHLAYTPPLPGQHLDVDIGTLYSQTSEQRTLWEQYKFSCCVLCREVVLFSEAQNVL